jgi:hypothetical protein
MTWLDNLERRLGPFAVPHVTIALIAGQVYVFVMGLVKPEVIGFLQLTAEKVMEGEWWRPITFLFIPSFGNIFFAIFGWLLFYMMGTALEGYWGALRYNLFFLVGWIATVAVAFAVPDWPVWNTFLMGSVFLAFAFLNPDFELYLMFILPVKIKWFALVTWCTYGFMLVTGHWGIRLVILASVCNFGLFFAKDLYLRMRGAQRRMARQAKQFATPKPEYFHRCTVCGITDRSHPQMEFRYCSKCAGAPGYCTEHLKSHEHVTASSA